MGRGSFTVEQRCQVCDTADTIRVRQQTIVQIVEVQNGKFVDGALPATRQKQRGQEKAVYKMCPAAQKQL
jgi:hypothetical protein